jgi:threonine dehydrogenase-like Zn-dependent dehydrogenase
VVVVKSVVLEAPGRLTLRDGPEPGPPGPGEALVRVLRVGICGTDLHAYRGAQAFMRYPIVLGHELAVEVVAIEPATASAAAPAAALRVGDRCTVIPYLADGTCPACRAGRSNCCSTLELYGVHRDGGMRERFVVPLTHLVVGNDVDPDVLAVVEMLAVGAHAAARAAVAPHERVLVLGAGPIGLSVLAFVRRRARSVHVFDVDEVRSAFARDAGLAESIAAEPAPAAGGAAAAAAGGAALAAAGGAAADDAHGLEAAVRTALGGGLPDVVVDATGHRGSMERAASLVEHGGRLVFVGHTAGELTLHNPTIHRRELTIVCSRNATAADFDEVLRALRGGELDVLPWITHRTQVERLTEELPSWTRPGIGVIKAVAAWPSAPTEGMRRGREQERP